MWDQPKCCICGNIKEKGNKNGPVFHYIPMDVGRRSKWCAHLGINSNTLSRCAYVCGNHITKDMAKLGQRLKQYKTSGIQGPKPIFLMPQGPKPNYILPKSPEPNYILPLPFNRSSVHDQNQTGVAVTEIKVNCLFKYIGNHSYCSHPKTTVKLDPGVAEPEFIIIKQEQDDVNDEDTTSNTHFSNVNVQDPLLSHAETTHLPNVKAEDPLIYHVTTPLISHVTTVDFTSRLRKIAPKPTVPIANETVVRQEISPTITAVPVPITSQPDVTYNRSKGWGSELSADAKIWKRSSSKWRMRYQRLKNKMSQIKPIYTTEPPMRKQLSNNNNKRVKVTYTVEQRTKAINLFKTCGRKGYELLRSYGYELPSIKTVEYYLTKQKKIKDANSSAEFNDQEPTNTLTQSSNTSKLKQ